MGEYGNIVCEEGTVKRGAMESMVSELATINDYLQINLNKLEEIVDRIGGSITCAEKSNESHQLGSGILGNMRYESVKMFEKIDLLKEAINRLDNLA